MMILLWFHFFRGKGVCRTEEEKEEEEGEKEEQEEEERPIEKKTFEIQKSR